MKMNTNVLAVAALVTMAGSAVVALLPAFASAKPVVAVLQSPAAAKVTPWAAMRIASHKAGGRPFSATYSFDGGHWSYDVILVRGHKLSEVEVNAMTGKADAAENVDPAGEGQELASDLRSALGMRSPLRNSGRANK